MNSGSSGTEVGLTVITPISCTCGAGEDWTSPLQADRTREAPIGRVQMASPCIAFHVRFMVIPTSSSSEDLPFEALRFLDHRSRAGHNHGPLHTQSRTVLPADDS